ncbi:glycosyltransferase [Mycobacterium sp. NPDC048908]|uniref:glycosyltransferase n=1 Tax=Mycobacterium sp. NPDC048908 TaxID=3364292 RepID=UPI00371A6BF8
MAHEWIAEVGGSENVFEQIRSAVPHSRAVCLWNDNPARFTGLEESWLARSPLRGRKVAAMPYMGSAWKQINLGDVDKVVVSSHAFSHHLASRAAEFGIPAFVYVHSPARYVWAPEVDDRASRLVARLGRSYFRRWDRRHASRKVAYAANSRFVAKRVADSWDVDAEVIYPPVDIERIQNFRGELSAADEATAGALPSQFVFGASRLVQYKNLDAAISAGEILDLPVVLAGVGPDEARLRARAKQSRTPVLFVGRVSDNLLLELYRRAALFVHMAVEDFGIMPVEAMASGTPVLVNGVGGSRESVLAVGGGLMSGWRDSRFDDPTVVAKAAAIDTEPCKAAVSKFAIAPFRKNLVSWTADDTSPQGLELSRRF